MNHSFKKGLLVLCAVLAFGCLASCSGSGTDPQAEDTSDASASNEPITLGGTVGGEDVRLSLTPASSGISRGAADEVSISGFIVYDDMTLNCSGVYDTATGDFVVSASGSFMTIDLVFSLIGKIVNGVVTEACIMLTVYENDVVAGSYSSDLTTVTETVEETSNVCTDTSQSYGFEGRWKINYSESGVNYTDVLTLTDTSFVYEDDEYDDSTNGTVLYIEEISGEWVMVLLQDENLAENAGMSANIEIYCLMYLRGRMNAAGTEITFAFDSNYDDEYYLTNYDLDEYITNGAEVAYSGYVIEKITDNGGSSPSVTTGITMNDLITLAKNLNIDTASADDKQTFLK